MLRRIGLATFAFASAVLLSGCDAPSHLMHVHRTTIGLSMGGTTEGNGHLLLGYKRREFFVIPKGSFPNEQDSSKTDFEAMSVLTCSSVQSEFLGPVDFRQTLATGEAAKTYAEKLQNGQTTGPFYCFKASQNPDTQ